MEVSSVGTKLLRSSGAATASQIWRIGVTFLTHMILRRLLPEDDWGLYHWAESWVFILLAQLRDLGLPAHVVRDKKQPYGTFLAIEVGWGAFLCLLVFAAAPLLARASSEPHVATVPVLKALVLFLLLEGVAKVPLTFFEAELRIDRALVPELLRNFCFATLSIALAYDGYGVFSLVIAHVAAVAVYAAALWSRAWRQIPLRRGRTELGPLIRTSLPLMAMALLLLALDSVDLQLVTAQFGFAAVGMYGAAMRLAQLIPLALEMPLRRALYPSFVAVRNQAERFFET